MSSDIRQEPRRDSFKWVLSHPQEFNGATNCQAIPQMLGLCSGKETGCESSFTFLSFGFASDKINIPPISFFLLKTSLFRPCRQIRIMWLSHLHTRGSRTSRQGGILGVVLHFLICLWRQRPYPGTAVRLPERVVLPILKISIAMLAVLVAR